MIEPRRLPCMASRDCIACNRTQLAIRFRIKRVALRVLGSLRPFRLWRSAEAKAARARDRHPQALSAVVPISDARRVGLEYRTKPHRSRSARARGLRSGLQYPARPQVLRCSSSWQYRLNATNQQICSDRQPAEAPHGKPDSTVLNPLLEHGLKKPVHWRSGSPSRRACFHQLSMISLPSLLISGRKNNPSARILSDGSSEFSIRAGAIKLVRDCQALGLKGLRSMSIAAALPGIDPLRQCAFRLRPLAASALKKRHILQAPGNAGTAKIKGVNNRTPAVGAGVRRRVYRLPPAPPV